MPVWSGVIRAEKTNKHTRACRHLLLQKFGLTTPIKDRMIIKMGKRNVMPVASRMPITHDMKTSNEKKGVTPSAVVNGYINLNVSGII